MNGRPRLLVHAAVLDPGPGCRQLLELLSGLDPARWEAHLVVDQDPAETGGTEAWDALAALPGLRLACLRRPVGPLGRAVASARLARTLAGLRPDLILDHGTGGLALLLLGKLLGKPVAWNLPGTAGAPPLSGLRARLSALVDLALWPSHEGLVTHLERGVRARRMRAAEPGPATEALLRDLLAPPPPADGGAGWLGPARYLVRFDDICPTMNWAHWEAMEAVLVEAGIKPILAVVPDNRDPKLVQDPPSAAFWDRVRGWQARGWTIALHGYQHTYVNTEGGILRLNRQSEFAGLPYAEQAEKLRLGLAVFAREGVRVDAWVAPSHSFDWATVAALEAAGIRTISDGMGLAPFRDPLGNVWVPQQFANLRPMPLGIWTFCYHLDSFTPGELATFRKRAGQLRHRMISLPEAVALGGRPQSAADRLVGAARQGLSALRRLRAGAHG
jgi:hypothetical protein